MRWDENNQRLLKSGTLLTKIDAKFTPWVKEHCWRNYRNEPDLLLNCGVHNVMMTRQMIQPLTNLRIKSVNYMNVMTFCQSFNLTSDQPQLSLNLFRVFIQLSACFMLSSCFFLLIQTAWFVNTFFSLLWSKELCGMFLQSTTMYLFLWFHALWM